MNVHVTVSDALMFKIVGENLKSWPFPTVTWKEAAEMRGRKERMRVNMRGYVSVS